MTLHQLTPDKQSKLSSHVHGWRDSDSAWRHVGGFTRAGDDYARHKSEADGVQKEEPMCCDNPNADHHKNDKPAKDKP